MSLPQVMELYGTEEKCEAPLHQARWPEVFIFPRCGEKEHGLVYARRDVGINPPISTEISVVLAPLAGIGGHHISQRAGCRSDALQYGLQMFDVGGLVAHAHRHDHLVVAVDSRLAVVALDVVAI